MAGNLTAMIASIFSGSAVTPDPFFEYTTLLLPGNGTNGAQNNTFLDGSTNNFTITRNGNTTQGTFSPFSQTGWGNYFSANTSELSFASNAAFNLSGVSWTIEFWTYPTENAPARDRNWITRRQASGGFTSSYQIYCGSGANTLKFLVTGQTVVTSTSSLTPNQWNHVAVVWNGTTLYFFINGVQDATTGTYGAGSGGDAEPLRIGRLATNDNVLSYMSNVRVVKGVAVYTGNFTVPSTPLAITQSSGTNISAITGTQTSLLTCQSNRFVDVTANAFVPTVGTGTSVQAFSPFNPTASWSAATNGGSGYFDGTGDYLSVADNSNLRLGTNAFTIQGWVYRNASGAAHSIIAKGGASTGFVLQVTSTNILRFTHGTTNVDTTTTIPASAWTHIAAVRTNTSTNGFQLYINGVSSATATVSTDFNQTNTLYAGADRSAANVMNGFISGLKYTNGTAESIAVPTEPPTATTNVALLLNFTNAGIYDATSKNDLETVGNAQISTAQSKWGGSSMAFDGTGDWLFSRGSLADLTNFGAGDFTIEAWVRFSDLSGTRALCGKWGGASNRGWFFYYEANNIGFTYSTTGSNATDALGSWTPSINTWYYVAVTRSGANLRLYVDGSQKGTTHNISTSSIYASTSVFSVAQRGDDFAALNGYLQDLRITKGVARNVTVVPTAAFPTL